MLLDLLDLNIFAFFLVFSRLGSAIAVMPGFSSAFVSTKLRLGLALAITFLVTPVLAGELPPIPKSSVAMTILIIGEVIIGGFIGMLARIFIGALQTAGTLIAYSASMANAMVNDPIAEQQSSTIAGFLMTCGLVLVFVADFHHLMLDAVVDSYTLFKPGAGFPAGEFADYMTRQVADSFALGLQMAAPFIIVALTYYIGLGILGRLMPTLQVFFFGLPFQLTAQIWVLMVTVSGILLVFMKHFQDSYTAFLSP
jgi:flagellar biosynthesis protein FliR